jgi:hypothetical protein
LFAREVETRKYYHRNCEELVKATAWEAGNVIWNVAPFPGVLSTSIIQP